MHLPFMYSFNLKIINVLAYKYWEKKLHQFSVCKIHIDHSSKWSKTKTICRRFTPDGLFGRPLDHCVVLAALSLSAQWIWTIWVTIIIMLSNILIYTATLFNLVYMYKVIPHSFLFSFFDEYNLLGKS